MGRKTLIAIGAAVLALLATTVGAYAWDASRAEEIAEGVRVANVELGGLSEAQAREALQRELVDPLAKPLVVKAHGERFKLGVRELDVHADVDGMLAEATAASREGWLPGRLWRYATGGEIEQEIEPRVAYSEIAVERFVEQIALEVNRPAQNATIEPATTSLTAVQGQDGVEVREGELRRSIAEAIEEGGADRHVLEAPLERTKPEVTQGELANAYPVYLTVDRSSFTLRLFEDLKLAKEYTIAVGAVGWDTPAGLYNIQNKAVDPPWTVPEWGGSLAGKTIPGGTAQNPLKARWLGIYDGAGIHGTDAVDSLGSAASHGCIRMAIPDVIELYDEVPVGAPIYIQ